MVGCGFIASQTLYLFGQSQFIHTCWLGHLSMHIVLLCEIRSESNSFWLASNFRSVRSILLLIFFDVISEHVYLIALIINGQLNVQNTLISHITPPSNQSQEGRSQAEVNLKAKTVLRQRDFLQIKGYSTYQKTLQMIAMIIIKQGCLSILHLKLSESTISEDTLPKGHPSTSRTQHLERPPKTHRALFNQQQSMPSAQFQLKSAVDRQDSCRYFAIWFVNGSGYLNKSMATDLPKGVVMVLAEQANPIFVFIFSRG